MNQDALHTLLQLSQTSSLLGWSGLLTGQTAGAINLVFHGLTVAHLERRTSRSIILSAKVTSRPVTALINPTKLTYFVVDRRYLMINYVVNECF